MDGIMVLRISLIVSLLVSGNWLQAQIERIEPPHWWMGMQRPELQLLVKGTGFNQVKKVSTHPQGLQVMAITPADSPDYLLVDLLIDQNAPAQEYTLTFHFPEGEITTSYFIHNRKFSADQLIGFNSSDVIYLITPDRFTNGDTANDVADYLLERVINRADDYARHGGDILGIIQHLDYIETMGFTAIWPSPVLENNMKEQSYHGYAITDFYRVDPRMGTLEDYILLSNEMRKRGLKLIMDQVANHTGITHWMAKNPPFKDWLNQQPAFEAGAELIMSNHRRTVHQDRYAAKVDRERMEKGWFVPTMPDLNQTNPFLAEYIIQNSIWWIETLRLSGIRQDTYPYPNKSFMQEWAGRIKKEYPNFSIVGEEWSYNPLLVGYWQDGAQNRDGYRSNLDIVMDFPLQQALTEALTEEESWNTGLIKLYEGLANDFGYSDPFRMMAFGDNHDMDRLFTQLGEKYDLLKMALAILATLPRIPQLYYGTEIGMENSAKPGDHGRIRTDFPGGWEGDSINAFSGTNLSKDQKNLQQYLRKVLHFRKQSSVIHQGATLHFAPKEGIYVLVRSNHQEKVVLFLNKNPFPVPLDRDHYQEIGWEQVNIWDVLSEKKVTIETPLRPGVTLWNLTYTHH
jgi:glycosidase